LIVSASPAYADNINSPHQKGSAAAGATATTWGGISACAGCHRAHTAQGAMLLKTDQESLCMTCHAGTGSTLDVDNGVSTVGGKALRGGGFTKSALNADNPTAKYYFNAARNSVSLEEGVVPTLNVPVATTSSHGMGATGAWGLGLSGGGAGTLSSPLECGSCHDPHGNGNYRLLQTVPGGVTNATIAISSITVVANVATVTTATNHWLGVGNTVTIAGAGAPFDGTWPVRTTPLYTTFSFAVTTADATVTPAAATAKNAGQVVQDAPSASARVYTTTDYWKVNDETTPDITVGTTTGVKAFIGSIAAWCTQCHTRYQTGRSGTYENASGDATFMYRHRGNSVKNTNITNGTAYPNQVNSANCIQCHVAHGSNATAVPTSLGVNFPGTTTAQDSSLLRVSNRGVCQMCHNK
jgi:predicted CXXCH cytochrome family protein